MAFQVQGKLYKVFDTEQKTESFRAREFILEISESQYPQLIKFQLTQDKCEIIDTFEAGETLTVHFDLRGREWNERFFTNLNAWKLDKEGAEQSTAADDQPPVSAAGDSTATAGNKNTGTADLDFDDDIPF